VDVRLSITVKHFWNGREARKDITEPIKSRRWSGESLEEGNEGARNETVFNVEKFDHMFDELGFLSVGVASGRTNGEDVEEPENRDVILGDDRKPEGSALKEPVGWRHSEVAKAKDVKHVQRRSNEEVLWPKEVSGERLGSADFEKGRNARTRDSWSSRDGATRVAIARGSSGGCRLGGTLNGGGRHDGCGRGRGGSGLSGGSGSSTSSLRRDLSVGRHSWGGGGVVVNEDLRVNLRTE
jgi:hypothetical protein